MTTTSRTKTGKFAKGKSGNPSGRPKAGNADLRQKLAEQGEAVVAVVVGAALAGDMQAAKIVLERLLPALKPSAAPVTVALPDGAGIADTARAIIDHAATGKIPADVAAQLVQSLGVLVRVADADDLEQRVAALEGSQ